jgi:hypothetical protein
MMKNLFVVFTLLILAPCTSIAKPTNYDECILENISNAQTNAGVGAVRQACRSLFPAPKKKKVEMFGEKVNFSYKKIYLTSVNEVINNNNPFASIIDMELINDTDYYVNSVFLVFKNSDCSVQTSAAIAQVQNRLNSMNFDAGRVDGKMGNQTIRALRAYQSSKGKKIDGKINNDILRSLGIETEIGWISLKENLQISPGKSRMVKFKSTEKLGQICYKVVSLVKNYD